MKSPPALLEELIQTVQTLRADVGCPWDRKQTVKSLQKYLREESDEIMVSIDNRDWHNLCEELGDFLYLIVMVSEISDQEQRFSLSDVITGINEKLIRRHPHVFGDRKDLDEETLRRQWREIKEREKADKK
jgi:uncharacterized protein YabN with tetrapyrrole methylase and pyrophosphatase domain